MLKTKFTLMLLAIAFLTGGTSAWAQSNHWPSRPITMVVPFAVGGSTDITARMLAEKLSAVLGQPVIVDNKTGAAGNIGASAVAKANPDGYTILLHTSTLTANVSLYKNMGFNLEKDLVPVTQVALIPNVLMVNKDFQAKTLDEFIGLVKQKKTTINYGSSGSGASNHLAGVLLNNMVGGEMVHVPYKGGSLANNDLLAGQIQVVFSPMAEIVGYLDGSKLRPLAVTTATRSTKLPNVPAIAEILPGYEIELWNGIFVPAATPSEVINKLSTAIQTVLKDPAIMKKFADQGSTPVGNSPEEFKKVVQAEIPKWNSLIKMSGAKVE